MNNSKWEQKVANAGTTGQKGFSRKECHMWNHLSPAGIPNQKITSKPWWGEMFSLVFCLCPCLGQRHFGCNFFQQRNDHSTNLFNSIYLIFIFKFWTTHKRGSGVQKVNSSIYYCFSQPKANKPIVVVAGVNPQWRCISYIKHHTHLTWKTQFFSFSLFQARGHFLHFPQKRAEEASKEKTCSTKRIVCRSSSHPHPATQETPPCNNFHQGLSKELLSWPLLPHTESFMSSNWQQNAGVPTFSELSKATACSLWVIRSCVLISCTCSWT